jgi:Ni/Fe-hydrogenase 1 B-type cytochrome subunit
MYKRVYVWELPVRILHWIHVASMLVLGLTGLYIGHPAFGLGLSQTARPDVMDWVRAVHFVSAYVLGLGFLIRLYWFITGNEYASWRGWVPIGRERWKFMWLQLKYYLFLERKRPEYLGHNPVSGLSYLILGVLIVLQGITGFALYAAPYTSGFWYATFGALLRALGDPALRVIHHILMYLFAAFLVIHLYMAILADLEERNGVMASIISGVKFERVEES